MPERGSYVSERRTAQRERRRRGNIEQQGRDAGGAAGRRQLQPQQQQAGVGTRCRHRLRVRRAQQAGGSGDRGDSRPLRRPASSPDARPLPVHGRELLSHSATKEP